MRRYLVVANQTLGGDELLEVIRERINAEPSEFWVLVPEAPSGGLGQVAEAASLHPFEAEAPTEPGPSLAQQRLDVELDRIRGLGGAADGEVRHADPIQAIQEAVAHQQFDEIILSTLPPGMSRWLHQDLPHRVQRKVETPLTLVVAAEGDTG